MVKYIYWQYELHDQDKAKKLQTGLFPYQKKLMVKLKQILKY